MVALARVLDGQQVVRFVAVELVQSRGWLEEAGLVVVVDEGQPAGLQGRIQVGLVGPELLLDGLALGDVDHHAERPGRGAVGAAADLRPGPQPAQLSVFAAQAHLGVEMALTRREGRHGRARQLLPVAGMEAGADLVGVQHLVRLEAQQGVELGRTLQGVGGGVVLPHRHAPGLDGEAELDGGGAVLLLLQPLCGDVSEADADAVLERPHPHLDLRPRPAGHRSDEPVGAALFHAGAVAAFEVRAGQMRQDAPDRLPQGPVAVDLESVGGELVQGDDPPLAVDGVETVGQAVEGGDRLLDADARGRGGEAGARPDKRLCRLWGLGHGVTHPAQS